MSPQARLFSVGTPPQTHRTSCESCSSSSDSESARRRRKVFPVTGMVPPDPRPSRCAAGPWPAILPACSSVVRTPAPPGPAPNPTGSAPALAGPVGHAPPVALASPIGRSRGRRRGVAGRAPRPCAARRRMRLTDRLRRRGRDGR